MIRNVLLKGEVSNRQFAKCLAIDYSSVFRFFRDGYDPKLSTLEKWALVLGVRIGDLFEEVKRKG